jgi:hypothetical protein
MFRYGTSWRGRRPGTRHWVSGPLWLWGLGWLLLLPFKVLWLMVLAEVWLAAEAVVLLSSGLLIGCDLGQHKKLDWKRAHWQRLGFWLWSVLVPEKEEW